ncbi:MAG: ketopantoate reductase family protein [Spirochaetales bacterium]|nr:ketopantoate reductase family protein [Spirochaetales bacterium]
MENIESVALIGAGALGLMYLDTINRKGGSMSYFLSDAQRHDLLKEKVFNINGTETRLPSRRPSDLSTPPDLVILCVKNHHLESVRHLLGEVCGPETIIISVLNGIRSEAFLETAVPAPTVLYTVVLGMDAVREGDGLTYTRQGKFIIGTKDNAPSEKLDQVRAFLERNGFICEIPEDIHREIWFKWMINIGINQTSALLGATYSAFQRTGEARALMDDAMRETISVAEASGISLHEGDLERWYSVLSTLGGGGKTSMLQDMEAMRKTEVESFAGELIELAGKLAVPVPVNRALYRLIKAKEEIYSGK